MNADNPANSLDKYRTSVARKVQNLRRGRHWTQAELARKICLSQSRLSEIEGGSGSFTAEQFLTILKLFNATVSDFIAERSDRSSALQNALARLGASHLQESADVLPSDQLTDVDDVVREAIVTPEFPRLITATAAVLVRNIDRINLNRLHLQLAEAGLGLRFAWLVENTLHAIQSELSSALPASDRRLYRRTQVLLQSFLDRLLTGPQDSPPPDVIDAGIRSKQTLAEVAAASSSISRRWGIVTALQPEDFVEALRGAREAR